MNKRTINNWVLLSVTVVDKWIVKFSMIWKLRRTAKGNKDFIKIYEKNQFVMLGPG